MKLAAAGLAMLLAAAPAGASDAAESADETPFTAPEIELALPEAVFPDIEEYQRTLESRPHPVNASAYRKVRAHLFQYGGEGLTTDGNSALCLEADSESYEIVACMNYALPEQGNGDGTISHAIYRIYTGPVEVFYAEGGYEITFNLSSDGDLISVFETELAFIEELREPSDGQVSVKTRILPPGSIEALMSWNEMAELILTLIPTVEA